MTGMAVFKSDSINTIQGGDIQQIKDYLFQNNELLRYMFYNLDPEENYSDGALQKYIERGKKISTLEFDVDGLRVGLKDLADDTETKFELVDKRITLEITNVKEETNTKIELLDGKIALKVDVGDVSNQISIEKGGISIIGERLYIETENLTLTKKGILSCTGGNFSGTVSASIIDGSYIFGGEIEIGHTDEFGDQWYMLKVTDYYFKCGNMILVEDNGRYLWMTDDEWTGMSPEMPEGDKPGRVSLWANYHPRTGDYDFSVSQSGNTRIKTLYVDKAYVENTTYWANTTLQDALDYIWHDGDYGLSHLGHEVRSLQSQVNDLYDMVNSL